MSDLEYRIGKLELHPGDVLVSKFDYPLSAENGRRVRDQLEIATNKKVKVLIIDQGVDLSVLTAEDIAKRSAALTITRTYEFNGRSISPVLGMMLTPLFSLVIVVTYPLHLVLRGLGRVGFVSRRSDGDESVFTYSIKFSSFRRT